MKRLNPETGKPFKNGDIRDDGHFFIGYEMSEIKKDGYFREKYASPKRKAEIEERNRITTRKRHKERRRYLDNIKTSSGCVDCGYKDHACALQFDHTKDKAFTISREFWTNMPRLLIEIAKCEIRCANCHAVITAERLSHAT